MEKKFKYDSVSAAEAVSIIQSDTSIFIHSAGASPQVLVKALADRGPELRRVKIYQLHTEGEAPYAAPELERSFRIKNLFLGANIRKAVHEGRADFIPVFLSEIPRLFRKQIIPLDVALVQVAPPDKNGFCTLGISVDTSLAAVQSAKKVIAEILAADPKNVEGLQHSWSTIMYTFWGHCTFCEYAVNVSNFARHL